MSIIEWIIVISVALVVLVILYNMFGGKSNAMGYTRGHGHCPNMGACNGCDICEGD